MGAALVVCLPLAAQAQDSAPPLASSVKMRMGPFEVAPSLLTSNGFDTNVTRVGEIDPISSYEFFSIPQLDVKHQGERFTLNGVFAAEFAYTPGEVTASRKSNLNNFGEVSLEWAKTVVRPRLLAWRRNTYARPDFEIGRKSQRIARTIDAGLDWVPGGRLRIGGGFTHDRTRYDADDIFAGVKLADQLNFDVYTPGLNATFKLTPMMELGGGLELTKERFLLEPARNGDGSRVFGTMSLSTPARMFASVSLGQRRFVPVEAPDESFNGLFARGTVGLQRGRTFLIANLNRDVGFSYATSRGFFVASTVLLNVRRALPRRLEVEFEGTAQQLVYHSIVQKQIVNAGSTMQRWAALGALGFSIRPWLKVGGNGEREVTTGVEQWDGWRFTLYTSYGSNRFRKLDRPLPR